MQNFLLLLAIVLLSALSVKRSHPTPPLHRTQTVQLRGFAALLVVLGHFWGYVATQKPALISHGETVMIFLFFSGFGIELSWQKHHYSPAQFIKNRVVKVMIPYWIVTIIILCADYLFLHRSLSWQQTGLTFAGINISTELNHLDYARWYITFLLIWYIAAGFTRNLSHTVKLTVLFSLAVLLLLFYLPITFAHQFIAYPLGVAAAVSYRRIKHRSVQTLPTSLASFCCFSLWLLLKLVVLPSTYGYIAWTKITHELAIEGINILFLTAVILLFVTLGNKGIQSRFLLFTGEISYFIFLLHGAFLIKYNPVTALLPKAPAVVLLPIFIAFIFLFALVIKKTASSIASGIV